MSDPTMSSADRPRVLYVAHGHPIIYPGGGEIAAHALFRGMGEIGGLDSRFIGWAPPNRVRGKLSCWLMNVDESGRDSLYLGDRFNHFLMSQENLVSLIDDFSAYLAAFRPDIVHFHHVVYLGIEALRIVRNVLPEARILLTLHEYYAICANDGQMVTTRDHRLCNGASPLACHGCFPNIAPDRFLVRERWIKEHYALVDMFISPSEFLRDRYVAWGLPADRIRVIANGHAMAGRQRLDEEDDAPGDARVFGFFGQMNPYKGLHVLLRAVKHLVENGVKGFRVDLHGTMELQSDQFKADLLKLAQDLHPHVRLRGRYRPEDTIDLVRSVDWLVVPSIWWENAPLVIQEGFIAGRPILCSDIGGMKEHVRDGVDGLHFRAQDPVALAELMAGCIGNRGQWQRLRANIRPMQSVPDSVAAHRALYDALRGAAAPAIGTDEAKPRPRRRAAIKSSDTAPAMAAAAGA